MLRRFIISQQISRIFYFLKKVIRMMLCIALGLLLGLVLSLCILLLLNFHNVYIFFIVLLSFLMTLQGLFTLTIMLYAWEDPEKVELNSSPKVYRDPQLSFTALVPARQEKDVIADTIRSIDNIEYPEHLKETFIICRSDDHETIETARKTISNIGKNNIQLCIYEGKVINKPHSLNVGLSFSTKDVVVVFDAEDEPHPEIYHIANTVMIEDKADVVQSGVQLMNYRSNWFSTLNVLEYYFWFKSILQFYSQFGLVPLGGNTVFFKRKALKMINGWDEKCLTEDADIGIRLSSTGAKMRVVYDERHATREETPSDLRSFIKQRTRWNHGFLYILSKGDWLRLPSLYQRIFAFYILMWPVMQALLVLYIPFSFILAFFIKVPVLVALFTNIPLYLFLIQIVTAVVGLLEFTKGYKLPFPFWLPLKIVATFYPFQIILGISALRALGRIFTKQTGWEKTLHINAHRRLYSPELVALFK